MNLYKNITLFHLKSFTFRIVYDIIHTKITNEVKVLNQILSIETPRKNRKSKTGNNTPIGIEKIIKFFAIVLIIFGIFMVGTGSYAMYQNSKLHENSANPTIQIEDTTATELTIIVKHNKELSKVTYKWNNEDEIEINCNGKNNIEEKVQIPTGKNTLYIYAVDVNGLETSMQKQYELQGDIDIVINSDKNKITIDLEGKEQLSYMTYRWDDEEETTIEIGDIKTTQIINNIPSGEHTLTVVVVDINNKTETKTQQVKGVSKPKINVTTDGSKFIIKASDEEGIKKIQFILNETEKSVIHLDQIWELPEDRREYKYEYPIKEGENKLEVRVYNESNVSENAKVKFIK